jgi:hypothetical protein
MPFTALNTPDSKSFHLSLFARAATELPLGLHDERWEHFLIIYEQRVIAHTSQYIDEKGIIEQRSFHAEGFGEERQHRRDGYFWYKDMAIAAKTYQVAKNVVKGNHFKECDTIVALDKRQHAMLTQHPDWLSLEGITLMPFLDNSPLKIMTTYKIERQ